MKISTIIFCPLFLFACRNKPVETIKPIDYTGFKERKVTLVGINRRVYGWTDTLGDVILKLPMRLDSFYQWDASSDCLGCGDIQYRFADKKYQHFMEAGFLWSEKRPDSIYQFTIQHNEIRQGRDSNAIPPITLKDTSYWNYLPHYANCFQEDTAQFLSKGYLFIKGKAFLTAAFIVKDGPITNKQTLFVIASTSLKRREYLNFIGECSAKDTSGFIESMYKSFASIQINERP